MKVSLLEIFWLFAKAGCCMFGGGIVILPLLEKSAVEAKGWLTKDELVEYYAISQLIPGINAPDVSMFVGYKLRGRLGALAAGLGVISIPTVLITLFAACFSYISKISFVKSALWGIEIGTIVILSIALRTIWSRSIVDKFSLAFCLFVFILTAFTTTSPVVIVFIALLVGIVRGIAVKQREDECE